MPLALQASRHARGYLFDERLPVSVSYACKKHSSKRPAPPYQYRNLITLAIETSCDDTSVAIIGNHDAIPHERASGLKVYFHERITADNRKYSGIHPLVALDSHETQLATLIQRALKSLPVAFAQDDLSNRAYFVNDEVDGKTSENKHDPIIEEKSRWKESNAEGISRVKPSLISVARGPGMRSGLMTGFNTAKGLALAWNVPLVGVHHMQAHALTPRLVSALEASKAAKGTVNEKSPGSTYSENQEVSHEFPEQQRQMYADTRYPKFPFLSLLVSGGHTILVNSRSLFNHEVLASTSDIAIGDCLDKIARDVLPPSVLRTSKNTMYGPLLEKFAFPPNEPSDLTGTDCKEIENYDYNYEPPKTRQEEHKVRPTPYDWYITPPFGPGSSPCNRNKMSYSFSGIESRVHSIVTKRTRESEGTRAHQDAPYSDESTSTVPQTPSSTSSSAPGQDQNKDTRVGEDPIPLEERRYLAQESMRVAFEHLVTRVIFCLSSLTPTTTSTNPQHRPKTLVVSGGVSANKFLLHVLRKMLQARGFGDIDIVSPPPELCTDNAAMIAWAGIEMFEAGWRTGLDAMVVRPWPLGDMMKVGGWVNVGKKGGELEEEARDFVGEET